METIFLKIKIKNSDKETNQLRNEGLFFSYIAEAINIDRNAIEEIDETNFKKSVISINKKYNDKSRSNKKSFRR
jgi:hypothetical protein